MLSRTADRLFWVARCTECAENTACILDVNRQTSLMPQSAEMAEQGWWAMLDISELTQVLAGRYGLLSRDSVIDFMVRDMTNPLSIMSCLRGAREDVRAVHGSLTAEVWETINTTWLDVQRLIAEGMLCEDPLQFFKWVKFRSHLSRGAQVGTTLTDNVFHFMWLGTFLERADNTARLFDAKLQSILTRDESAAEQGDPYHWAVTLRSVSGFGVYRKTYRNVTAPTRVAELLILRNDIPRSLSASMDEAAAILSTVRNSQPAETERRASKLHADLRYARIGDIFLVGPHAWLINFLERIGDLGNGISQDFPVPLEVA